MSRSAGSDAVDAQISMDMLAAFIQARRVQQCVITLHVQTAARTLGKGAGPDHQRNEFLIRDFTAALYWAAPRELTAL